MVGEVGTPNAQFLICVEKEIIFESKTFIDIIFDIIGTYYNFDICYNKQLLSILLFFQCYVINVDRQETKKIPDTLANFLRLVNSLN